MSFKVDKTSVTSSVVSDNLPWPAVTRVCGATNTSEPSHKISNSLTRNFDSKRSSECHLKTFLATIIF